MREFYYQGKQLNVPDFRCKDCMASELERNKDCDCAEILADRICNKDCSSCVFSCTNAEARLAYLKVEGYLNMSKSNSTDRFYYEGKGYKVPSAEYHDIDTVVRALKRVTPCGCSELVESKYCVGVACQDCIFSFHNPEARLEYLKMKGIVKTENNDTMPEIKGGMLLRFGSNNEWVLTVNEESGYVLKLDKGVIGILGALPQLNQSMIKSIFYRADSILFSTDMGACMEGRIPSYKDIKYWEREEVKELTMADLEKHFGCKVKIVKDN